MIGLNKIGLNQVQLNRLRLNAPFPAYGKMAGGGGSGDGFPQLPGDVTRWHFGGLTNEMMAAMDDPRIEDVDHKGRFLSFKNFAWGGMSGVGGYTENYNSNKWYKVESRIDATWTYKSFNARSIKDNRLAQLFYQSSLSDTGFRVLSCTIKVSGLTDGQGIEYVSNGTQQFVIMRIENDGIYHLPSFDFGAKNAYYGFKFLKLQESCNITIEQLPLYPGFILGDGVDDFAVTEKELNFEDTYTVYTAFIPFQNDPARNMTLCGKNDTKDFSINYSGTHLNFKPSTGVNLAVRIDQFALLVCKRNKDITTIINLSTGESRSLKSVEFISNPGLYYLWRNVFATFYAEAAIAGQTICNGYFSTDEDDEKVLDWYKKQYPWLFPDQAWTVVGKSNEDKDRATIANITGNSNDLVLSNVAFSENSGYGSYPFGMNVWNPDYIADQPYGTVHYPNDSKSYATTVKNNATNFRIKFRLRGLPEGGSFLIRVFDMNDLNTALKTYTYTENGIHEFVYNDPNKPARIILYNGNTPSNVSEFYLDIIPEYEGYLVTDGVDDIASSNTIIYEADFTFIGEWKFIQKDNTVAGINSVSHLYIQNRYNRGATVMINSTFENKKNITDYMTFKAITSKGKAYDENWNEVDLLYGDGNKGPSQVSIGGQGGSDFCHMIFKNMALYMNKVFSKDECIKAYNYLQTLKAK